MWHLTVLVYHGPMGTLLVDVSQEALEDEVISELLEGLFVDEIVSVEDMQRYFSPVTPYGLYIAALEVRYEYTPGSVNGPQEGCVEVRVSSRARVDVKFAVGQGLLYKRLDKLSVHSAVALAEPVGSAPAGAEGVVVNCYDGGEAYEVEFSVEGETFVETVYESQMKPK